MTLKTEDCSTVAMELHNISRIFRTLAQRYCENLTSPRPRHVRNGFLKSAPFSES